MVNAMTPRILLRIEGLGVLVVTLLLFAVTGGRWIHLAMLILVPDLSILGYLAGPQKGAAIYNVAHTYTFPGLLGVSGWLTAQPLVMSLALVWAAHIALDRILGFGLKYPTAFKDTHLHRI
jgi:hypothetical protein